MGVAVAGAQLTDINYEVLPAVPTSATPVTVRMNYTSPNAVTVAEVQVVGNDDRRVVLNPVPCLITCPPDFFVLDIELGLLESGLRLVEVVFEGQQLLVAQFYVEPSGDTSPQLDLLPSRPSEEDFVTATLTLQIDDCIQPLPSLQRVVRDTGGERWRVDIELVQALGGPPCEPGDTRLGSVTVPLGALPAGPGDVRVLLRTVALPLEARSVLEVEAAGQADLPFDTQELVATSVDVAPGSGQVVLAGRFEVSATFWDDAAQSERPALVVPVQRGAGDSVDSALLGFYQRSNWELLVKVLDGCAINQHFWTFVAAATDVGWRVEVRDRVTDSVYSAEQMLGAVVPPITDVEALAVCE